MPESDVAEEEAVLRERLVDIWQEVLLLGAAHPDVDFVEVDGSSLTAVRLANRVREVTGRRIGVGVIFEHPTPRDLAAALTGGTA